MKRSELIQHLNEHGCQFLREGRSHSIWTNPRAGGFGHVPRHTEIRNHTAREICRRLSIPIIGRENR